MYKMKIHNIGHCDHFTSETIQNFPFQCKHYNIASTTPTQNLNKKLLQILQKIYI